MSFFDCQCKSNCTLYAVFASIIIGIVAAVLRITAVITVSPAFLWVLFGIAVVYLAILVLISAFARENGVCRNLCARITALLAGILGTILFAIVLLGISFEATSILGAIFVGLLLFFFSLIITVTACLVKCLANCGD